MKVANKISVSFLITGVILTTTVVYSFYTISKSNLTKSIHEHLKTATQSRADHIEACLANYKTAIRFLTRVSGSLFRDLLSTSKNSPVYTKKLEIVNNRIKVIIRSQQEMSKITLLDKNGIVVTSSHKASIGSDRSDYYTYLNGNKAPYQIRDMHISKVSKLPAINASIPLFSNDELLGVIIAYFNVFFPSS